MKSKVNILRVYVAGKVRKDSVFGTHDWRDEFVESLSRLSGRELLNIDPVKSGIDQSKPREVFGADCKMIKGADVVVVYLTDDISVGGSQEILIAKYFTKPVIGLAPRGGKFNGANREYFGKVIKNYRDPFVFSTCDVVCDSIEEVAHQLRDIELLKPMGITLIDEAISSKT